MSGIDVQTQKYGQKLDPYLGVVVDPVQTMSSGRVEIGAFRTYPDNYEPHERTHYQTVPMDKIQDWGDHADSYYKLTTTFIQSDTDNRVLAAMQQKYPTYFL